MYLAPIARKGKQAGQFASHQVIPPPVLGLNTKDPLLSLKAGNAVVLDNWWSVGSEMQTRRGCEATHELGSRIAYNLAVYHGQIADRLFLFENAGVTEVSSLGVFGAGTAGIRGPASTVNFATAAGRFLLAVNGVDPMHTFDGTTWKSVTDLTTPSITGIDTDDLDIVATHQRRVWFGMKQSLDAYYLEADVFAGAASRFALGSVFQRGGKLANIFNWSVDGGNGQDDFLCFYTTAGEVAVYSGFNPADTEGGWQLVGVYYVGEPVFGAPVTKFGGDVVILTVRGIFLLSQALQANSLSNRLALTDSINPTFQSIASIYSAAEGWSINVIPSLDMMLITTPAGLFAANVTNKAWHRFLGWGTGVKRMVVWNKVPFYLTESKVAKGWSGATDFGGDIIATAIQAPQLLGRQFVQKFASMMKPTLRHNSDFALRVGLVRNYEFDDPTDAYSIGQSASVGVWDLSNWNEAVWAASDLVYSEWLTSPQWPATHIAPALQVSTRGDIVRWLMTEVLFESGGVL